MRQEFSAKIKVLAFERSGGNCENPRSPIDAEIKNIGLNRLDIEP